jgi:hypothetical protein
MLGERNIWVVVAILSIIVILVSGFFLSISGITYNVTMENSGSSSTWESLGERNRAAIHFLVDRPFWDEIWFGILGLFCAYGLKKRASFAWNFSVFWSIMLIAIGIIIASYEIIVLEWDTVCMLPVEFLVVGGIALACLLAVKQEFKRIAE